MIDILNLSYAELEALLTETLGEPKFRAVQIWQWLWQKLALSFDEMSDVSKSTRAKLQEIAEIRYPEIVEAQVSADGTEKLLLRLHDGALVETVLIPSTGRDGKIRMAQCVSSQVGCAMGCTFCSTGGMGFVRNMTAGEILGQVLVARKRRGDTRIDHPIIRNLVFMGMGEPLLNLREVTRALEMLHHPRGMDFSSRRITVSTCGIKAGLQELGEKGLSYLAVSLHAPNQALREQIMPKAARWPLDDLISTLADYPLQTRELITFEYLLLGGVNDSPAHAAELARLIRTLKAKINLIAYNPSFDASGSTPYRAPSEESILAFEKVLWDHNIVAVLRKSKGQDIKAACGQLRSDYLSKASPK
ncbi:MAG: 23S rRNA (adenine(2503)-C(2))-methyltransferase RlmN [Desulfovibrionaceae bacterium]|nr:23S rRNA (adenine(2503)-C(2))-methyltransferase RlmN [Desulfovibrionaceae bacterium]